MSARYSPIALTLVVALSACGVSPRRGGWNSTGYPGPNPNTGGSWSGGGAMGTATSSDPRQVLSQLHDGLRSQGYSPLGPAVHGNLPANGLIAYAITAQPGVCYSVVALGQTGQDLNITVQDPQGRPIGHDVRPDEHPWATVCPGTAGTLIVRLQMLRGQGEYYYAAYQGPTSVRPDLTAFFGGAAQSGPRAATLDAQTRSRLETLDSRLGGESFRRLGDPIGLVLGQQEERNFEVTLERGRCYAFASLGGPGATDTDIFLVDHAENVLANDAGSSVDGLLRYCAPQAGAYRLKVKMYGGQGPLFTATYVQGAPQQPTQVIATQSTAGAGLEENFRLLDSDMRARGYEPLGEQQRGQLGARQTRDNAIQLEGGKCYAILAVGDNGVRDLDLALQNEAGATIDQDVEADARPIVRVCPQSSGRFNVQMRMADGAGNIVYAQYRWPRGTRGPFGLGGLQYVRLSEVTSLLAVEGYEPDVSFTPGRGNLRRQGDSHNHEIDFQQGQCYAVVVVGGPGVADLDLVLAKNGTEVATDGIRNAFPTVRHCAQERGRHRLTVRAANGTGSYFYQVFKRTSTPAH